MDQAVGRESCCELWRRAKGAAMMGKVVTIEREQTVLLGWLELLGWTVEIDREGGKWVGLARRVDQAGEELCIGGSASTHRELVSKLFSSAARSLALQAA
jgi:hypothetical protein